MPRDAMPNPKPKRSPTAFDLFCDDGVLFMPLHMSTKQKHEELKKRFEDLFNSEGHSHRLDKYFDKADELFVVYLHEYDYWEEMKAKTKEHAKKMKASKPMKSSKQAMKRSKLLMRRNVYKGKTKKTTGGLPKGSLTTNKYGKVVSKAKSVQGKKNPWSSAITQAHKDLNLQGFVPAKKGSSLYKKAKSLITSS